MKRIALLSNVTVAILAQQLEPYEVYVPDGYDTWAVEILNPDAGLYSERLDAVLLLLDGTESRGWSAEQAKDKLSLWQLLAQQLAARLTDIPIFISTILLRDNPIRPVAEYSDRRRWELDWYDSIHKLGETSANVYAFDLAATIQDHGLKQVYSDKMWYFAAQPYSRQGLNLVAGEILALMEAAFGRHRKLIVVDMDNTLWGGVIGEDGTQGLSLADHGAGQRFYDLQRQLLEMKNRGVLLALASKNNPSDVSPVWEHPDMLLNQDDFVAAKIGWEPKPQSVQAIAAELNLGESSFVFLDDNPAERAAMTAYCPDVLTWDFPDDTSRLYDSAAELYKQHFRPLRLTREDMDKTEQYRLEGKRQEMKSHSLDLADFIDKLEMQVAIRRMRQNELERCAQLCNKTNQFNVTSRRYTAAELQDLNEAPGTDIFVVYASDKFGDSGLISVLIVRQDGDEAAIDTFLMSCRVMGRGLEQVILTELNNYYFGKAHSIAASFIPTARNKPVEQLYDRLGFDLTREEAGAKQYRLELTGLRQQPQFYAGIRFEA